METQPQETVPPNPTESPIAEQPPAVGDQLKLEQTTQAQQVSIPSAGNIETGVPAQTHPIKESSDASTVHPYTPIQLAQYQAQMQVAQAQVHAQIQTQTHTQSIQSHIPVSVSQEDLRQFQTTRMNTANSVPIPASHTQAMAAAYAQSTSQQQYTMQVQLGVSQFQSQLPQPQNTATSSYLPPMTSHAETVTTPLPGKSASSKRRTRDTPQGGASSGGAEPFYYPDGSYTRCLCDENYRDDGVMIQCENCDGWQHAECMGVDENQIPEQYYCELCKPDHPIHISRRKNAPNGVFFSRKPIKVIKKPRKGGKSSNKRRTAADEYEDHHVHVPHNLPKYETELTKPPSTSATPAAAATPVIASEPVDELHLSREERKIKRAVEQFDRLETRIRRHDASTLDSQVLEAELAQLSMSNAEGDTARLARMRQRARAKASEEQEHESSSMLDGDDDEEEEEEEAEPIVTVGPSRSIFPKQWVCRSLVQRCIGYLPLKHTLIAGKKVREAAGALGDVVCADAPISKRLVLSYQNK